MSKCEYPYKEHRNVFPMSLPGAILLFDGTDVVQAYTTCTYWIDNA